LAEVLTVGALAFAVIWMVIPRFGVWGLAGGAAALLAMMIGSNVYHRDGWARVGVRRDTLAQAFKEAALFTLPSIAAMWAIGYALGGLRLGVPYLLACASYPLWGLTQQYLFQGFVYNRVSDAVPHRWAAIVITGCLFSSVHVPNLALMAFTLFSGLVWTWLFSRTRNLVPLGISHGLLASTLVFSAPPWLLPNLVIGPRFWEI